MTDRKPMEPVAWMTPAMAERLAGRGWTEGRLYAGIVNPDPHSGPNTVALYTADQIREAVGRIEDRLTHAVPNSYGTGVTDACAALLHEMGLEEGRG